MNYRLKGNEEFTISLYKDSIQELTHDLSLVKNDSTKKVIQDEIDYCIRRVNEIERLMKNNENL
jgi:hypothetical protein